MSRQISLHQFQQNRQWLPDTEIVNDDGKVIAYMPPPIKPVPLSWRERLARWLMRVADRIDPLAYLKESNE